MNSYDRTFEQLLRERLAEGRNRVLEEMAAGCPTFDWYNKHVGYLMAIKEIEAECEDIRKKMTE